MRPVKKLLLAILILGFIIPVGVALSFATKKELNSTSLLNDSGIKSYYRFESSGVDTKGLISLSGIGLSFNAAVFGNGFDQGSSNSTKVASSTKGTALPLTTTEIAAAHTTVFWVNMYSQSIGANGYSVLYSYAPNTDASNARSEKLEYFTGVSTDHALCGNNTRLNFGYGFGIEPSGAGNKLICTNIVIDFGKWYHIAVVYDGSAYLLYVNGTLRFKDSSIAAPATVFTGANLNGLSVGSQWNGFAGNMASAQFDDFGVFNRELTSAEINTLAMNAPFQIFKGDVTIKGRIKINGR